MGFRMRHFAIPKRVVGNDEPSGTHQRPYLAERVEIGAFVGIILWILGAIFSLVGIFRAPRGLAIAGTVISFIGIIVLITFFGALIGFASM